MSKNTDNNNVTIVGEIVSDFIYSHEVFGDKFYTVNVRVNRISDTCDIIPVMVSDRLIDVSESLVGTLISVSGQFRSYNCHEEKRNKLVLYVFAGDVDFIEEMEDMSNTNNVSLDGYICKEPVYRKTPLGREIADLLLAVNRHYGKSDYIPCVCWGRNARYASRFVVGQRCFVSGRIQSREYLKKISDTEFETRTAYEVSVSRLDIVDEKQDD